jgi:hypothetical protein
MDSAKEIRGAASGDGSLPHVADDQGTANFAEGSAWQVMEAAYMAASGNGRLSALARQIFYQARPKIMEMTEDKQLNYGYFSQTLLPDYIEEHGVSWKVVYDARGHFEEPHTNRRMGVGTIEVGNYLRAMRRPRIIPAEFSDAKIDVIGPDGNLSGVLFCEKEGFGPLFKEVNSPTVMI